MLKVYGDSQSGNCYKIKLLMALLDIPHHWQHVDILSNQTHSPEFLAMNTNGKVPVLEIDQNTHLSESNAILNYLADGTAFLPNEPLTRAQILQWQFFEQYSHEPYIAVARYIKKYLNLPPSRMDEYKSKQPGGHKALALMDQHLSHSAFLVGTSPTIADVSLYAYTHVAEEGGFDLSTYHHIAHWLDRIKLLPKYIAMP